MNEHILLVEDDPAMQSYLSTLLKSQQHPVTCFSEGLAALQFLTQQSVELILLDLGLNDIDGQDWLQQLRSWSDVPVMVISARHGEQDKVQALDNGANDYITKPFSSAELMARVRAALRQVRPAKSQFRFAEIEVDPINRTVLRSGQAIHLTKTEFQLLLVLLKNSDKVLTHNQILESVWGHAYIDRPEYVRVHIGQLRQKLEVNPATPQFITTEPGVGYRFKS